MINQRLKIKLSADGATLIIRPVNRQGQLGTRDSWEIRKMSQVPKRLFFLIQGFTNRRAKQVHASDVGAVRKAVLRGLCEAAEACGCEPVFGKEGADVLWLLGGLPFFAFQVDTSQTKKIRLRKMLAGASVLRWTIVIMSNGLIHMKPRGTKKKV